MINLAACLTGINPSQCMDYRISRKSLLMACKSLMARILVMDEEIDDQELLLVGQFYFKGL